MGLNAYSCFRIRSTFSQAKSWTRTYTKPLRASVQLCNRHRGVQIGCRLVPDFHCKHHQQESDRRVAVLEGVTTNVKYDSAGRKLFLVVNYIILTFLALTMSPFLNVIAQSFSAGRYRSRRSDVLAGGVYLCLLPACVQRYLHLEGIRDQRLHYAIRNLHQSGATASLAYPLSRPEYVGRKTIMIIILMTMIFTAPLIPQFILMRELNLVNTLWSLMRHRRSAHSICLCFEPSSPKFRAN